MQIEPGSTAPSFPHVASNTPGRPAQTATRLAFFIAGFGVAAWAPLVPLAKQRAGLDDGVLGLLLLCLAAGSIITMPLAGALAARYGCRIVILVSTALICATLPLLATLGSLPTLAVALLIFGAGIGGIDCAMNVQAIIVERASGRPMMSGFHGLFSVGCIAGPAAMAAMMGPGLSPLAAALAVVGCIVVLAAVAAPHLLTEGGEARGPAFALPRGIVLFIGALCFVSFLGEGAMLDWGAIFLISQRQVEPAYAGLGYACFAATMTLGRLTGDAVVGRLGATRVLIGSGVCAAGGLALATLVPSQAATLIGYALVGAGCSNIVPVMYSAVGRQRAMSESLAVPAVTTLGYAGMLVGPAAIGFVANASSLSLAFLLVAAIMLTVSMSVRVLRRSGSITD
ncbi:MFS transporter [soil metagenome]